MRVFRRFLTRLHNREAKAPEYGALHTLREVCRRQALRIAAYGLLTSTLVLSGPSTFTGGGHRKADAVP